MKFNRIVIMTLAVFLYSFSVVYAVTADDAYQAGVAYYKQGQWDQSIGQLNASIALNPSYWQAYQVIGYDYAQEGNSQAALTAYQQSLQINPNNPQLQQIVNNLQAQNLPAPSINNMHNNSTNPFSSTPTPTINSDTKIHNSFYFNLSGVTPASPNGFATNWSSGGSLGVAYGFGLNNSISIVLSGQYSNFPYATTLAGYDITGGNIEMAMFLANTKFVLTDAGNPVGFYLIAGIGPSLFTRDAVTVTEISTSQFATLPAVSEVDFALRFGLGIDIRLDKGVAMYIETNGVDTFVSQQNATQGPPINNMFSLGMKFDN